MTSIQHRPFTRSEVTVCTLQYNVEIPLKVSPIQIEINSYQNVSEPQLIKRLRTSNQTVTTKSASLQLLSMFWIVQRLMNIDIKPQNDFLNLVEIQKVVKTLD